MRTNVDFSTLPQLAYSFYLFGAECTTENGRTDASSSGDECTAATDVDDAVVPDMELPVNQAHTQSARAATALIDESSPPATAEAVVKRKRGRKKLLPSDDRHGTTNARKRVKFANNEPLIVNAQLIICPKEWERTRLFKL